MNGWETDAGAFAGGPLMVSGGGSTKVATAELFAESAVLRSVVADAQEWLAQLRVIRSLTSSSSPGWSAVTQGSELTAASAAITEVEREAAELAGALDAAAENYGAAERDVERLFRQLGGDVGWYFGFTSHLWGPVIIIPTIAGTAISCLLASMITGTPLTELPGDVMEWFADHPEIYTDPAFVQLVAVVVASVDDTVAGRLVVPLWLSRLLGDDQLAVLGASTSAAGLLYLARSTGIGKPTAMTVKPAGQPKPVQPPKSFEEAIARIPRPAPGVPQILIEHYPGPDGPVWFVYAGGTVDWSPIPGDEPFDMSSNLQAVAQGPSASREALETAMRDAGIQPGDTVQAFGHSQGGLIVAQVAESGNFDVDGVTTFGAPSGQVPVNVSTLAFEHSDDVVVATGGQSSDPSPERLVVGRQAYLDRDIPKGQGLPAHQTAVYAETAVLADRSEDPRVMQKKAATFDLNLGPGTGVSWRADRVEPRRGGDGDF